jgi:hypothetical protein
MALLGNSTAYLSAAAKQAAAQAASLAAHEASLATTAAPTAAPTAAERAGYWVYGSFGSFGGYFNETPTPPPTPPTPAPPTPPPTPWGFVPGGLALNKAIADAAAEKERLRLLYIDQCAANHALASLLLAASVLLLGGMAAELQRTASLPLWNRMQAGLLLSNGSL